MLVIANHINHRASQQLLRQFQTNPPNTMTAQALRFKVVLLFLAAAALTLSRSSCCHGARFEGSVELRVPSVATGGVVAKDAPLAAAALGRFMFASIEPAAAQAGAAAAEAMVRANEEAASASGADHASLPSAAAIAALDVTLLTVEATPLLLGTPSSKGALVSVPVVCVCVLGRVGGLAAHTLIPPVLFSGNRTFRCLMPALQASMTCSQTWMLPVR